MTDAHVLLPVLDTAGCCEPFAQALIDEEQAGNLASLLKAIADPARLRLLSLESNRKRAGSAIALRREARLPACSSSMSACAKGSQQPAVSRTGRSTCASVMKRVCHIY